MFNINQYRKLRKTPIIVIEVYLIISILLYFIGPFEWKTYSPLFFCFLLFLYNFSLCLGYNIGIKSVSHNKRQWNNNKDKLVMTVLLPLSIINVIFILIVIFRNYGFVSFDLSRLSTIFIRAIGNKTNSYTKHLELISTINSANLIGGKFFSYINFLWEFFEYFVIVLDIYYFRKFGILMKLITIVVLLETAIYYLSIWTSIGVFRIILPIVIIYLLNLQKEKCLNRLDSKIIRKKQNRARLILFGALLISIVLFSIFMNLRKGGFSNFNVSTYRIGGIGIDNDSILFSIIPEVVYMPIVMITAYLTQGYYGLSMATQVKWDPMFGIGQNMWLVDLLEKNGVRINQYTYQYKIDEMFYWDERVQWASMYTWVANDVGLFGVAIVMVIIGLVFAVAYRDCIISDNPFAYVLVVLFALMFIFMPCNNQVFQTSYTCFSFITAFVMWFVTTRL